MRVRVGVRVKVRRELGLMFRVQVNFGPLHSFFTLYSLSTNDGEVKQFTVARANWQNFTDEFGTDLIPLVQTITLETTTYKVVLTFTARPQQFARLLYPFEELVFSDFEAIGTSLL